MNTVDRQYEDLLADVLKNGVEKKDRTGVGTLSVFGRQLRYDLNNGFPRITTKFVPMKAVKAELLWQIEGSTSEPRLKELGANWWAPWADRNGELGPVYGRQMRMVAYTNAVKPWLFDAPPLRAIPLSGVLHRGKVLRYNQVDQLAYVVASLKHDPDSRRHVITLWSPAAIPFQALPPCHGVVIQFYVENGKLSCSMYQRSADLFLGLPTNIASYSLLTHMVAQQTGYDVGEFIWTGGDCHIYKNHVVAVREQLGREPYPSPELSLKKAPSIFDYQMSDIYASAGYKHHPAIKAPVAV